MKSIPIFRLRFIPKSPLMNLPYPFGNFSIDSTLGRDTQFGILVDDAEVHYIKSVSFTDDKGFNYGPFTSFSSEFNVINLKTINFLQDASSPPFDDVSIYL